MWGTFIIVEINMHIKIFEYDPVRIYITLDGDIQILFHRITLAYDTNYLIYE